MGREIERKFLIERAPDGLDRWPADEVAQGYLSAVGDASEVRVRRRGDAHVLTVKRGQPPDREEVEVDLDAVAFAALWPLTDDDRVEKTRHRVHLAGDLVAEVDVYAGDLEGLLVAEVEFASPEQAAAFVAPDWFGPEVTDDPAYGDRRLAAEGRP